MAETLATGKKFDFSMDKLTAIASLVSQKETETTEKFDLLNSNGQNVDEELVKTF